MLGVSIGLGFLGLLAFLWGLRTGQFDDKERMMRGVLFDGVEELNEANGATRASKPTKETK